ncbi:MAG: PD-(D/E)XK nuclease family protein [Burkholderiaceae bacterium]|jgi:probable DNA repair protein|nr:PD-(D/E)XK nuclease family protein [Burkholderiaceae bacterium]MDP4969070.1 PD-(D/E)XK nuclease family protein [Burkholderiaceae bacterium]MDP5111057.1 PD-(D/E)XK nuclease family protein [Burkholderiaceae bacterium]
MINFNAFPRVSFSALARLEAAETIVLTVNNRLARRVVQEFALQSRTPASVGETPLIVPWSGWISQQLVQASFHESLKAHAVLLDPFGSQLLWGKVIDEVEADEPLLDSQQAAIAAQQADKLIDEWRIEVTPSSSTEEHAHFMLWRERYRQELERLEALDPNLAIEQVIEHVREGFPVRPQLLLAGFSEITPRMAELLEALRERGVSISVLESGSPVQTQLERTMLDTTQDEWVAAAHWARMHLEKNPEGRFAIVAVSLEAEVAYARRTLTRVLQGSPESVESSAQSFSFNVAVARPLSEWQAVRAVLAWLRSFVLFKEQRKARASELGAALLAGYCAGDLSELGQRACVDADWRHHQVGEMDVMAWSKKIERLTQLSPAWQLAWQAWTELPRKGSLRFWSTAFRQTLSTLGFPGRAQQSSTTYQVIEALDQLFERFDALSPLVPTASASEALNILSRFARSIPFQPQRDPSARLDVLGMLEAEGGRWDGVWILGLTDEVFPAIAKPNPFVPLSELRRVGAPRATPEREREWATHMYQQLCALAPKVVLSSARHEGERGLRPSPLIQGIALSPAIAPLVAETPSGALLEYLEDDRAPALRSEENVTGGIALLETQARNPLWAFVRYRLGAYGLPAYSDVVPASARGKFLHKVMELVWLAFRSQAECQHVTESGELRKKLEAFIRLAADKELLAQNPALRALEEKRALAIVTAWLAIECAREPFVAVQIEEKHALTAAGLTLNVRLDRMDQLEDGSRVVLDYKGGSNLPNVLNDWGRERPVHLQLPAYAAVLDKEGMLNTVAGLMLVHLHSGAQAPVGLLSREIGLEGPTLFAQAEYPDPDWSAAIIRLKDVVHALASEFTSGLATNQSWSRTDLQYCDVSALLRRYDDGQQLFEDSEEMTGSVSRTNGATHGN